MSGKKGIATALTATATAAMCKSAEPACRRARSRSRAPSARETSAVSAIIRPILIEMAKYNTTVAKPTPAVSDALPSHEM
jgi:hypothetical protein